MIMRNRRSRDRVSGVCCTWQWPFQGQRYSGDGLRIHSFFRKSAFFIVRNPLEFLALAAHVIACCFDK